MNQKIIFNNQKTEIIKLINDKNPKFVLIVTSDGNVKRGYTDFIVNNLKKHKIYFSIIKIFEYPDIENIPAIYKELNNHNYDLVISIGGGSVIDFAKIYSNCENGEKIKTFSDIKLRKDSIFHISIPTTSGSGSESTSFATIWSKKELLKYSFDNPKIIPNIAVLIPEFTISLNKKLTLTTSLDSLCHCLDSLSNKNNNIDSKKLASKSVRETVKFLPDLLENLNNLELRKSQLNASNLAGQAINITRTSLNHAISYPLTNLYNLPHGFACAFSTIGIFEKFNKTFLKHSNFEEIKVGIDLIKKLDLEPYYKNYLKTLEVEKVIKAIRGNKRLSNFIVNVSISDIEEILYFSKSEYNIQ